MMNMRKQILAGAALAALALGGCSKTGDGNPAGTGEDAAMADGPNHGDNPAKKVPYDGVFGNFAMVFLQLDANGKLQVRHAYFETKETSLEGVNAEVHKILTRRLPKNDWTSPTDPELGPAPIPGEGTTNGIVNDFRNFYFGAPMRVYVYSALPSMQFDANWPVVFSKYGGSDWANPDGSKWKKRDKNNTFYNAQLLALPASDGMPAIDKGQLIYVENHFKDRSGQPIKPPKPAPKPAIKVNDLSVNFNMLWESAAGGRIPVIIDPDTGNGMGSPPPP